MNTYREREWPSEKRLVIQSRDENKMTNKEKTKKRQAQRRTNKFTLFK